MKSKSEIPPGVKAAFRVIRQGGKHGYLLHGKGGRSKQYNLHVARPGELKKYLDKSPKKVDPEDAKSLRRKLKKADIPSKKPAAAISGVQEVEPLQEVPDDD